MKNKFCLILCIAVLSCSSYGFANTGKVKIKKNHTVYFDNTDYELHVYKLFGEKPGKTIMLIGGIQGDEPGGFLTADSYADISLEQGNLIVVPRANLPSILLQKRSINVDMNRKFADDDSNKYEGKIVKILKELISESDCLLNLHDGSGFFHPEWISDMKNPMRFGQSVIADFKNYTTEDGGVLKMEEISERVVKQINTKIDDKDLYFRFNNHRTAEKNSMHKEQRKSATYFAVTRCNIPAFGIETSKSLSLLQKVKYHQYAINAFMEEFGIIPELPPLKLEKPLLKYIVLSVNNQTPIVVKRGESVYVRKNDVVKVSHVEANYERGLTVDFIDMGSKNDIRKNIKIDKDTRISAIKDSEPCGSVYVKVSNELPNNNFVVSKGKGGDYFFFHIRINKNQDVFVKNDNFLNLYKGDFFEIVDVFSGNYDPSDLEVNIKGYVNSHLNNTGEDRGCLVDTSKDFWDKYSMFGKGLNYPVVVSHKNNQIAKMNIRLLEPHKKILVLKSDSGEYVVVEDGKSVHMKNPSDFYIFSAEGIPEKDFCLGFYSLVCNGKKVDINDSKVYLDSLDTKEDQGLFIDLMADHGGIGKVEARFNIKNKESF